MKNIIFSLAIILSLSHAHAHASVHDEDIGQGVKRLIHSNALDENEETQLQEWKHLEEGISYFFCDDESKALEEFRRAIDLNGSPLGYLYAAVLEDDAHTSDRYFRIAFNAVQANAIPQEIYDQHIKVLLGIGSLRKI